MGRQTPEQVLDKLRAWCKEQRGRNLEIAKKLGVSKQLVTDWLKNRAMPTWEIGTKIQEFLEQQQPPERRRKKPEK
jgi:transcriptional regulator with XRE-family HTH domain